MRLQYAAWGRGENIMSIETKEKNTQTVQTESAVKEEKTEGKKKRRRRLSLLD